MQRANSSEQWKALAMLGPWEDDFGARLHFLMSSTAVIAGEAAAAVHDQLTSFYHPQTDPP